MQSLKDFEKDQQLVAVSQVQISTESVTVKENDIAIVSSTVGVTTEIVFKENLDKLVSSFTSLIEKCLLLYQSHKLEPAYLVLNSIIEFKNNPELGEDRKKILQDIYDKNLNTWLDMEREYKYMKQVLTEIEFDEGWTTQKANDVVTIKYKYIPNTALVSLKIEGEIECPLINLLTLIYETDLYTMWVPFMSQATVLKTIHRASKVAYIRMALPFPLSDRAAYLAGLGVDRLEENGSILVLAGSIDGGSDFMQRHGISKVEGDDSTVKVDAQFAGFEIKPNGPNKCVMRGITNVDPKIPFLPAYIINWILRMAGGLLYGRIADRAKNMKGTQWEENRKKEDRKEFYEWLEKRLDQYFQEKKEEK